MNLLIFNILGRGSGGSSPVPDSSDLTHDTITVSGNPVNIFIYEPEGLNLMSSAPVLISYLGDGTDDNNTVVSTDEAMSTGDDLTYTKALSLADGSGNTGGRRIVAKSVVVKVNGTPVGYGQFGGSITGTGISTGTCGSLTSTTPTISVTFSSSQSGNTVEVSYITSAVFIEGAPWYMNEGDHFDNKGLVVFVQNRGNNTDLAAGYFDEVIKYLWNNYTINPNRIGETGLSRGGRQATRADQAVGMGARYKFWITNSTGVVVTSDPGDPINYTESGLCAVSAAATQYGGTYTLANYAGIGVAIVQGTADSTLVNGNPNYAGLWGADAGLSEYPYLLNLYNINHTGTVWHNNFYNRLFRPGGAGTAKWDYADFHWKYSRNLEECATLFVELAEDKRGSEAYQIINYREAVRKVSELSSGATKTALEGRLATLKTDLDGDITWRLIIAHGTSTVNYSGSGYNTMTSHTDNQRVDDLKDDNNNTLSGVDFFIGNNPITSNFQAEIGSNRGRNNAGGFPKDVNRSGFRVAQASGTCPMGFDGLPSGTYRLRVYANEGSGSWAQRELTATINSQSVTQFFQGNSLYCYAEWTGSHTDFASYSLETTNGELYVTATELVRLT